MSAVIALDHVDTWVFDLDNTLYPADTNVMGQVEKRMTEFVMRAFDLEHDAARTLQKQYWHQYGTTLNGLISNHDINQSDFLDYVHDVDHDVIDPDPVLADHIRSLDGRKLVFTNGSIGHAEKVIDRLGLNGLFNDLYDIEAGALVPKPHRESFERFNSRLAITPGSTVMFEDSPRNLQTAADIGYTTVLIRAPLHIPDGETAGPDANPDHVHYIADCLRTFLGDYHAQRPKPK